MIKIQTIYLSIILLVMGEGLKNLEFIRKNMVIWLLLIISVIVNFIFYGININTFLESAKGIPWLSSFSPASK